MTNSMSPTDMKSCYSIQGYADHSTSRSSSEYAPSPYYSGTPKPTIKPTKIIHKEEPEKSSSKLIPKTESSSTCCSLAPTKTELLVKPELASSSSCRSNTPPPPPPPVRPNTYDSYLNHDSNSSSVSSMDTMGHHQQHHQLHPGSHLPVPPPPVPPHHIHPPPPPYSSMGLVEDSRSLQHRSPYDANTMVPSNTSEDMYHRPEHAGRSYPMNNGATLNRPVPSYSTEMTARGYEVAGHRPYDPGTTAAYDRYEAPPQTPCPQRYPEYGEHEMRSYEPQHHQMPGIMKQDQSSAEGENPEGPLYPR